MLLKEENHLMKLELIKLRKKSDILEKDLQDIRRSGEESSKVEFSYNMTNFYQVSTNEINSISNIPIDTTQRNLDDKKRI